MPSKRTALALALVAGVVVVATASAATTAPRSTGPVARAAGGDAGPPLYPSIVNVRMERTESLLSDATAALDDGDSPGAIKALTGARSNLAKAWTGAKYVIENAPATPPVDDARISGGAVAGASPFADQYATAVGVLGLQHDVAVATMGMIDTSSGDLLTAVSKTLFASLNARDAAIAYIHSKDTPPPPGDKIRGRASDGPVSGWATSMPGVSPYIDDELQHADAVRATVTLSPGRKRLFDLVELQDTKTEKTIAKYWPPPLGD
jgi:hypothetical protein